MPDTTSVAAHLPLARELNTSFRGDTAALNNKIVEGRILESAIAQLAGRPGFNPAAISVVFGLKW
ncbi:hypothetical protein E4K72_08655 [Oxalobacteraceae bacterium OM1]|nr:hypothetical protein E4K72_08655 [Oxalobacteraceae bacterium OM1]